MPISKCCSESKRRPITFERTSSRWLAVTSCARAANLRLWVRLAYFCVTGRYGSWRTKFSSGCTDEAAQGFLWRVAGAEAGVALTQLATDSSIGAEDAKVLAELNQSRHEEEGLFLPNVLKARCHWFRSTWWCVRVDVARIRLLFWKSEHISVNSLIYQTFEGIFRILIR